MPNQEETTQTIQSEQEQTNEQSTTEEVNTQEQTEQTEQQTPDLQSVSEEALGLLSHFTQSDADKKVDPDYQKYLEWKQQQQTQQPQTNSTTPQTQEPIVFDDQNVQEMLSNPKAFSERMNGTIQNIQKTMQQQLIEAQMGMLYRTEVLVHLVNLESKYPHITENPQALQAALMRAQQLGLSPQETAAKAVEWYNQAYNIRNSIIKNKKVENMTGANPTPTQTQTKTRANIKTSKEEPSMYDEILGAYGK